MREIKFRGKSIETGEWIYGYYVYTNDRHRIIYEDYEGFYCEEEVDPETVGEYISLKDKAGREIYEGDLLTDYGEAPPLYVEYSEKHGAFCFVDKFDPSGTVYYTPLMIYYEQMEVIGNIYDNPELLEVNKKMDKKKFGILIYALTKHAARDSFDDFLEVWGLTWDDYKEIRDYLKETYGVETYL